MLNRILNSPAFAGTVVAIVVGALLSIFLVSKTVSEIISWGNSDMYPQKTITVNGEGEVLAVPNIATFSFSVLETAESVDVAQNRAAEKTNKAIEFLKSNNVEEKDIKSDYNTYPKYDYGRPCYTFDCPQSETKIIGYEVNQTVTVKVRQQEDAGRFLSELGKIGVSNISGLSFSIDDEDALYEESKQKAIANAKLKADKMAKELDIKLGDIVSFGENTGPMYPAYGMGGAEASVMKSDMVVPNLPQGENEYKSSVWITYEIK
jgi:uncharacterized protein